MMKYISTRGNAPELTFEDVLLTGLATDGGLYVPKDVPQFSLEEIESWRDLPYTELAHKVIPNLMREHRTAGWVRADQAALGGSGAEVEALKARIEMLEKEREDSMSQARPALKTLSRGGDLVTLD